MPSVATSHDLRVWVTEARARSIELVSDLTEEQLRVPYLPTINPLVWEMCHAAYFYDFWVLGRGAGGSAILENAEELFDSTTTEHEMRWRLPVPGREKSLEYVREVRDRVLDLIDAGRVDARLRYLISYAVAHDDMHTEALTYTRQTLGYPAPALDLAVADRPMAVVGADVRGDAEVRAGTLELGAARDVRFCHDNEKWAHPVDFDAFSIARTTVNEGDFAAFTQDRGYGRRELWSHAGWSWRLAVQAELPAYWRRNSDGALERRHFDHWSALKPRRAMVHVSWYEAEAWCRWAGRRLPSEVEWEAAASLGGNAKRFLPWGDEAPRAEHCNMDWQHMGSVDANAYAEGDSAAGCRQMIGNVWEWTATTFAPYPDFDADMYEQYSQSSFHTRKVLRGGSWATRSRSIRNTWRNYYQLGRRDVFAGFRTCAIG